MPLYFVRLNSILPKNNVLLSMHFFGSSSLSLFGLWSSSLVAGVGRFLKSTVTCPFDRLTRLTKTARNSIQKIIKKTWRTVARILKTALFVALLQKTLTYLKTPSGGALYYLFIRDE